MELYTTVAQVIPVLALALAWDSKYLQRKDLGSGKHWDKPRIARWGYFAVSVGMVGEAACLVVIADVFPAGAVSKWLALAGIAALMATVWVRMFADIHRYTGVAVVSKRKAARGDR